MIEPNPFETLRQMAAGYCLSRGLHVVANLAVADSLDDYVERAVILAEDLPHVANLRATLRERVAASPLCDGKKFAMNLAALLRQVWRDWCAE